MLDGTHELAAACIASCRAIAGFTESPGNITRTYLCESMRDCHAYLQAKMDALHMRTRIDSAGNLRGLYPGAHPGTARLVIGSHLDTVPDAGAFDGILGVVLGLALVEALDQSKLSFDIEVIGFSEEEGVRFGFPFIGSRAFTGTLDDHLLLRKDSAGISVACAMERFGLHVSQLSEALFDGRSIAYLEFHIEQGPVLESIGQPLAVVDSIAGQSRATVLFEGEANHAGTTPMPFRRDALTAAAEWISAVEARAQRVDGLVATVGKLDIPAGATNVVPGKVIASLDVRHANDGTRQQAFADLIEAGMQIAERRSVAFSQITQLEQSTVSMDPQMVGVAEQSLRRCGLQAVRMASGAGHDAMVIAPFIPSVVIFLRSPNGLSHHPNETVLLTDVSLALQSGLHFLEALGSTLPYK